MQIEFSRHALDQLKIRRRITRGMVITAITKPDQVNESYRGRKLYQKTYKTDTLEVVVKEEDNVIIVITAYILGQQP